MFELPAEEKDAHGFRSIMWHITNIGLQGGLCRQEYAMEFPDKTQFYLLPNGQLVMRAFAVKDIKFFNSASYQIGPITTLSLAERETIDAGGLLFKIQKNRQNNQLQRFKRNRQQTRFCFVRSAIHMVENALYLGQAWDQPLCVYQVGHSIILLTGADVTEYYRFVTRLVFPQILNADLNLISTHSLRIKAAVLLHEAGKDAPYIKLHLRWLSDCSIVYLRNTQVIMEQHNAALAPAHVRMISYAIDAANLPTAPAHMVAVNSLIPDLEDED